MGGGSLTALPIIETQAGDISAYIPTNVISITDGQIFLQTDMFNSGVRPAVDSGLSVSRVGSSAQIKAMKKVSGSLKLQLAQYREMLSFAQFGSDLDAATKAVLDHGERLTELLKQDQYSPMTVEHQVVSLLAANNGCLKNIPVNMVKKYEKDMLSYMDINHKDLMKELQETQVLSDSLNSRFVKALADFTKQFEMTVGA